MEKEKTTIQAVEEKPEVEKPEVEKPEEKSRKKKPPKKNAKNFAL